MEVLVDAMLGSLARWLRFAGVDAEYAGVEDPDEVIAARAVAEGRWLVTMDRELASVGPRTVLIRSGSVDEQFVELCRRLRIEPDPTLDSSRCAECNGELEDLAAKEARPLVPPYVARTSDRFRRCRRCQRIYWKGTHSHRIRIRLEELTSRLSCGA
jgi:uncharacterized protein with PIN domain